MKPYQLTYGESPMQRSKMYMTATVACKIAIWHVGTIETRITPNIHPLGDDLRQRPTAVRLILTVERQHENMAELASTRQLANQPSAQHGLHSLKDIAIAGSSVINTYLPEVAVYRQLDFRDTEGREQTCVVLWRRGAWSDQRPFTFIYFMTQIRHKRSTLYRNWPRKIRADSEQQMVFSAGSFNHEMSILLTKFGKKSPYLHQHVMFKCEVIL